MVSNVNILFCEAADERKFNADVSQNANKPFLFSFTICECLSKSESMSSGSLKTVNMLILFVYLFHWNIKSYVYFSKASGIAVIKLACEQITAWQAKSETS